MKNKFLPDLTVSCGHLTGSVYRNLDVPSLNGDYDVSGIDYDRNGNIRYTYDAMGNKLKKTRTEGQNVEETLYISGLQYIKEGNGPWQMEFVQTAEGRVVDPMGNRLYEYDIKDHLGNSRVMFSETGETISEVPGYYPFGMTFDHPNVPGDHKFLYQNKEYQNELGLETYDFEWRMYDPAIARTFQLNPHAENYFSLSPYSWVANNPLLFVDPDGRDFVPGGGAFGGDLYNGAEMEEFLRNLQMQFGNPQDDEDEKEKERKRKNEEALNTNIGGGDGPMAAAGAYGRGDYDKKPKIPIFS